MARSAADLTPEKALIWRVVHRDNIPWLLEHGVHCASSAELNPDYVSIGLPGLIEERRQRSVPVPPGGVLADYVPFYFTPFSPMVKRIVTGRGVPLRRRDELCFLVTSLHRLMDAGIRFLLVDRHAALRTANFLAGLDELTKLPWPAWQRRDFVRTEDDPAAFDSYQAETLIHRHLPASAVQGIVCHSEAVRVSIAPLAARLVPTPKVVVRPEWYL